MFKKISEIRKINEEVYVRAFSAIDDVKLIYNYVGILVQRKDKKIIFMFILS